MNKPEFQAGDRVWHPEQGWGTIIKKTPSLRAYKVKFDEDIPVYRRGWWELFYQEVELPSPEKPVSEIDWSKVPPKTPVQARDSIAKPWENVSFLVFLDKNKYPVGSWQYLVYYPPHGLPKAMPQCRLAPDVEIKEEWLK